MHISGVVVVTAVATNLSARRIRFGCGCLGSDCQGTSSWAAFGSDPSKPTL